MYEPIVTTETATVQTTIPMGTRTRMKASDLGHRYLRKRMTTTLPAIPSSPSSENQSIVRPPCVTSKTSRYICAVSLTSPTQCGGLEQKNWGQSSLFALLFLRRRLGAGVSSRSRWDKFRLTYVPPEIISLAPFSNSPLADADRSRRDALFPSMLPANHPFPSSIRSRVAKFLPASSC